MAFKLIDLPYDDTALAPAISAETLSFHHGKHHQAYIDKTNKATEGTELEGKSLEDVIASARGSDQGLFNNAAQSWNHGFYWHSLSGEETSASDELQAMIEDSFGLEGRSQEAACREGCGSFRQRLGLARREGRQAVDRGNA